MSLSLLAFHQGIRSSISGSTLEALINGAFLEEAPETVKMPYVVYYGSTIAPDYRMSLLEKPLEYFRLSLTAYDDRPSVQHIDEIAAEVEEIFGEGKADLAISPATYKEINKRRLLFVPLKQNGVWQYTLDYEIQLEKL